jgi:outer membrane receptor protein involved in Fe transport
MGVDYHLLARYASPRPYTYAPSASGVLPRDVIVEPNNARMERATQLDLRLTRSWSLPQAGPYGRLVFFFDVRNLTDRRNVLWVSSDGRVGGELGDPGALSIGRRTRLGLEVRF